MSSTRFSRALKYEGDTCAYVLGNIGMRALQVLGCELAELSMQTALRVQPTLHLTNGIRVRRRTCTWCIVYIGNLLGKLRYSRRFCVHLRFCGILESGDGEEFKALYFV